MPPPSPRSRHGRRQGIHATRSIASTPELALSVYGIEIPDPDTDRFLSWVNRRTLRIGDEIRIRLAKTEKADRPRSIRVFRRVERDAGERTYYERLKKKFEGPKRAHRKR